MAQVSHGPRDKLDAHFETPGFRDKSEAPQITPVKTSGSRAELEASQVTPVDTPGSRDELNATQIDDTPSPHLVPVAPNSI